MKLLNSTKSLVADTAILEAIKTIQERFPKKILGVYVTGSYANGYAVSTSDLDLYFVFDENLSKENEKLGEEINRQLENITPALDIAFRGLPSLLEMGEVGMRENYLHVFGEPVHLQIPSPSMEDYIYRRMHSGYLRMQLTRKTKPYTWPMDFPDDSGSLKGYDWREKISHNGKQFNSIKEIVVLTGWMATGLIAWKGNTYVPTKNHVVNLFKSFFDGPIATDFETTTEFCRTKLAYMAPDNKEDRQKLEALLPQVLKFENFFLENYQHFLIENLENTNPIRVRTSIIRLGEILYPNDLSLKALNNFATNNSSNKDVIEKSISQLVVERN
ncbi:MAG: nucleotidyltransferase domain-containing protein [Bdellovibrionales bacterium]|nr:nucleotidyltransferase domain-containing protein [Bdellovibrionales bacterium]